MKTNDTIEALIEDINVRFNFVSGGPPLNKLFENISDDLKNLKISQIQFFLDEKALLHMAVMPNEYSRPHCLDQKYQKKGEISVIKEGGSVTKGTIGQFGLRADDFQRCLETMQSYRPNFTLEAVLKSTIENVNRELVEKYQPSVIWDCMKLYGELKLLNSAVEDEEELFKFFNNSLGGCVSDLLPPELRWDVICRPPYPNIVCTIEEFCRVATNQVAANGLVSDLKILFADCLLSEGDSEKAWRDFRKRVRTEIQSYASDNPTELRKTVNLLYRLLWLITGLVPLVTKEKRMMLFGGYTKVGMCMEKFEHILETRLVPSAA
jgi:hypothetical protein